MTKEVQVSDQELLHFCWSARKAKTPSSEVAHILSQRDVSAEQLDRVLKIDLAWHIAKCVVCVLVAWAICFLVVYCA
jgi:hypothetical protein